MKFRSRTKVCLHKIAPLAKCIPGNDEFCTYVRENGNEVEGTNKGERGVHLIGISCWQNGRQKQETGLIQQINYIPFPPLMPFISLTESSVKCFSPLPAVHESDTFFSLPPFYVINSVL